MSSVFRTGDRIVDSRGGMLPSFQLRMQQLWDRAGGFGDTAFVAPTIAAPVLASSGSGGGTTVVEAISAPAALGASSTDAISAPAGPHCQTLDIFAG